MQHTRSVLVLVVALMGAASASVLSRLTDQQRTLVLSLVANMTLAEKIGQMTQGERANVANSDVSKYFLGSVLSGGGSLPGSGTVTEFAQMYDAYQAQALSTRLAIPIIYGQDAVHGVNNVKGATMFPHNIGLGATRDANLMHRIGNAVAEELLGCGSTWTFAPCVAVARDDRWGRTYESFGESPELPVLLAPDFVNGLQETGRVQACVKHYVGDGGTTYGTGTTGILDRGNTIMNETMLREIHLPGYVATVNEAATVMISYSSWNGLKMHAQQHLITDVLKGELGFEGFVISDYDAIYEISGTFAQEVAASVNAGVDMFMMSSSWLSFINTLTQCVQDGTVALSRIDDAVTRILAVKARFGLFDSPYSDRSYIQKLGTHRELAREAVQKSLVLLQNKDKVLPLSKTAKILVTGNAADNLGYQLGGWSIWWQGGSGAITNGTTIYQGIKNLVTAAGGTATYSSTGSGASSYDAAIVVIGETPYAEYSGDISDLTFSSSTYSPYSTVLASGIPVVLVIVSGRPRLIPDMTKTADAIVAAFLPGTEGQGVADVLFGDVDFTGKLPVTWPKKTSQEPINVGDSTYDPLFPYGWGLNLSSIISYSEESSSVATVVSSSEQTVASSSVDTPTPSGEYIKYKLVEKWDSTNFFDGFDFFSDSDPAGGYVYYTTREEAFSWNLAQVKSDHVEIWPDTTTVSSGSGRASVRISSKETFNSGLFVLDVRQMPSGCGTWPKYWLLGDDLATWPAQGEIDLIEGINTNAANVISLHTSDCCSMASVPAGAFTGSWSWGQSQATTNCYVSAPGQWYNQGCAIQQADGTYGASMNANGGGVYAALWNGTIVEMWFFKSGAVPCDLDWNHPKPQNWGTPGARFDLGYDCDAGHFRDLRVTLALDFCGDWASGQFWGQCSGMGSCQDYVQNNPSAFSGAYWSINSLKIFQPL